MAHNNDVWSSFEEYKPEDLAEKSPAPQAHDPFAEYETVQPTGTKSATKSKSFMDYVDQFNKAVESTGAPALAGGFLHGSAQSAANIGNLGIQLANILPGVDIQRRAKAPDWLDPRKKLPQNPINHIMENIGEFGGDLLMGGGAYKAAGKIPALSNEAQAAAKMLRSALAGTAVAPEDSRVTGAIAGAAIPAVAHYTPLTRGMAAAPIKKAKKLAGEGANTKLDIPNKVLEEAERYLSYPNKEPGIAIENLMKSAQEGGYDPAFTIQSELARVSRGLNRSLSGAERLMGQKIGNFRQDFLGHMKESLAKQGKSEAAEQLAHGQERYRRFIKQRYPRMAAQAAIATYAGLDHNLKKLLAHLL